MALTTPENKPRRLSLGAPSNLTPAFTFAFPVLLFLVAFLPRIFGLVARSTVWRKRAIQFIDGVSAQDWEATLQGPHPGVTTMWLAGLANKLGRALTPDFNQRPLLEKMVVELLPLVLVISLAIVLAYFLLARIFDRQVAAVSTLLLALDPFHISISKTLHVDALMAVFVMISVLWLWLFISPSGRGRLRYVMLSGIFGGLALLSKTPALFLVPYLFLCVGAWQISERLSLKGTVSSFFTGQDWSKPALDSAMAILLWLLVLATTYYLIWPSMWSQPVETLRLSFSETLRYADTPHPTEVLFMGQPTEDDPGPLFYPVYLLIKTTIITLPFFLASFAFLFSRRVTRHIRLILLLGFAFVFFYTLQMILGEKKFARYLLPAFEFVILLSGFGAVYFFRWLAGGRRWLLNLSLILVIAVQAAISLPRHPYYGTHFNLILGGPKSILENGIVPGQEQGEGLDIAANYLNNLPASDQLTAGVLLEESFARYFQGHTLPMRNEEVDYLVFARNWIARETRAWRWRALWEAYQQRDADYVVSFDGVPYVWVYEAGQELDYSAYQHEVGATVGQEIRLLGYDLEPEQAQPGETIRLTLYWEATEKPSGDYTVFTHLLDPTGRLQGQKDHQPHAGEFPTIAWEQGELLQDDYLLTVADDAPPGSYELAVGMYVAATLERLPITSQDGLILSDHQLRLAGLEILPPSQ